jgi:hypothetical protein
MQWLKVLKYFAAVTLNRIRPMEARYLKTNLVLWLEDEE